MKKTVSALCLAALLSGCSMVPDYLRPEVATPGVWKEAKPGKNMPKGEINADWWKNFKNKELDALMDKALENNYDLKAAVARIRQARAEAKIAGASLLPSIDGSGGIGETKVTPGKKWANSGNAGLDVSYELDIFGGNRAGVAAARANLTGSVYDHDALALVVISEVAKGYFGVVNARERVALAQGNLTNARNVMKIVQARFDAGSSSALDVSRQKSEVATNEAALAALQNQAAIAEDALSILMGEAPQNFRLHTKGLQQVKVPKVPLTQPSSVAEQRPDIRKAEQDLIAANADIGLARSALYPSVNLSASGGALFTPIGDPFTRTLALAAALVAPIFHGGALEGGVEKATARETELAQNYRKIVLTALQEVEDALASAKASRQRAQSLSVAMQESRKTYELSRDLYEAGSVDYQTMLDAQRTLLTAEDSHAVAQLDLLDAAVDLYKALGGGWVDKRK